MLAEAPLIPLVPIRDAAKARAFYETTLGLRLVADEHFALVFAAGDQTLRLTKINDDFTPYPFSVLAWQVSDIAAAVRTLSERGVEFLRYPHFEQDELGIWTVPGGAAKVAWFLDPDGNNFSLVQG